MISLDKCANMRYNDNMMKKKSKNQFNYLAALVDGAVFLFFFSTIVGVLIMLDCIIN